MDSSLRGFTTQARKNQSFSSHLSNRFHAVGYTASFEKHSKIAKKDSTPSPKRAPQPKTIYIDGLTERQYMTKCEDEAKLRAIEQQLEELKRKRALKEKRMKQRAESKRRYVACSIIQSVIRSFLSRKHDEYINVIVDFLKTSSNKQAITAAAWATKVLRRFFINTGLQLRYRKAKATAAKKLSSQFIQNVNRNVSDNAYKRAKEMERLKAEADAAEEAARAQAKKAAKNKKRMSPMKLQKEAAMLARFKAKRLNSHQSPPKNSNDGVASPTSDPLLRPEGEGAATMSSPSSSTKKSVNIVNSANVPTLYENPSCSTLNSHTTESTISLLTTPTVVSKASSSANIEVFNNHVDDKIDSHEEEMEMMLKQMAEEEEERQRLLEEAHLKRKLEMENERLRRLKLLEKNKLQREAEARKLKETEEAALAEKEKKKMKFFKKIMNQQSRKAKMMAKVREEKERSRVLQERLAQRDSERQKAELKLMMIEERLSMAADVDRVERERQIRKKRRDDALNKAKQEAKAKLDAQVKRPLVPRLSAAYRKEIKVKEDAKKKFEELDVDKNGYIENEEVGKLIAEVVQPLIEASDLKEEEKASYMASLISRMNTNQDGKLYLQEFTGLWSQMRAEINRKDTAAAAAAVAAGDTEEANRPWYEKQEYKNSPMAVLYLGLIDSTVYEVIESEIQEQKIEQERLIREKEKQMQRRVAERMAKEKAQREAIKAMEDQKKENMDKVLQIAKKLAQAAPTRSEVRRLQRKKIVLHQKRQIERKARKMEKVKNLLGDHTSDDNAIDDITSIPIHRQAPVASRYDTEMTNELGTPSTKHPSKPHYIDKDDTEKIEESPSSCSMGDNGTIDSRENPGIPQQPTFNREGIIDASIVVAAPIPPRPPVFGKKNELNSKLERPGIRKTKNTSQQKLMKEKAMKLKKKEKLGRVASLLAMVHQARKKLGSDLPGKDRYANVVPDNDSQEQAMDASWKRFAQLHSDSVGDILHVDMSDDVTNANTIANENIKEKDDSDNNNNNNNNLECPLVDQEVRNKETQGAEEEEVVGFSVEGGEKETSIIMTPSKFNASDLSSLLKEAGMNNFMSESSIHDDGDDDRDDYSNIDGNDNSDSNDDSKVIPTPLDAASLALDEDIMNDCSVLTDSSEMGVEIDMDWIRSQAPPSKVGLLEGFSQENMANVSEEEVLGSPTQIALRNADSAVSLYTEALNAANEVLDNEKYTQNNGAIKRSDSFNSKLEESQDTLDGANSENDMVMMGLDDGDHDGYNDDEDSVSDDHSAYEILVDERQRLLNRLSLQLVPNGVSNDALDMASKTDQTRE